MKGGMELLCVSWYFWSFSSKLGLSLSKEWCRAGLHQKTEIVARDLGHPSTGKVVLPPRASITIASFLRVILPHPLPLRLFFHLKQLQQRKFHLFPDRLSSQCFCRHFQQPSHSWQLWPASSQDRAQLWSSCEGKLFASKFSLTALEAKNYARPWIYLQSEKHLWPPLIPKPFRNSVSHGE